MTVDANSRRPNGMPGLFIIWLGQMISGTASNITYFALPLWILNKTGTSGSALAYWEALFFASYLVIVLFAGVFVDRYNRKLMMLVYDFLLFLTTVILLLLVAAGRLEVWHLYLTAIIQGVGYAFRLPSYSSVITLLVPRKQYTRANGMMSLLDNTPDIFGPILAGLFYFVIGLSGILVINLVALVISIGTLLVVDIPLTPHTAEGDVSHSGFIKEALYGIRYIIKRPALLSIQLVFFFGNIFSGMALSVTAIYTMLSLRTGGNPEIAGTVQSVGALAALLAGVFLSIFGRFKKPVRTILFGWLLSSLFGLTLLGIGQILMVWVIARVIDDAFGPVINVAMETFLQTKIPPDVQGRVFSASDYIAQAVIPITPLLAGYLGERVFEPAMHAGGTLTNTFGWLVGTGPGAGFGLMIFLCGIGGALVGLWGFFSPAIRNVDQTLPDFEILPPVGLVRRDPTLPVKTEAGKDATRKTAQKSTKRTSGVQVATRKKNTKPKG